MDYHAWSQQALGVAGELGFRAVGSDVLASATHLVLKLQNSDVVAKIGPRDQLEQFQREVAVVRHLQAQAALCLPLSERLPPGPHLGETVVVSFWQYLPPSQVDAKPSLREIGRSLEQLHDALASYRGPLPDFMNDIPQVEGLLGRADRRWLSHEQEAVLRRVFEHGFHELSRRTIPRAPLHGDAHVGNLMLTVDGPRWLDFEDACLGPREWDIAAGPYPPPDHSNVELLQVLLPIRAAFAATWCSLKSEPNEDELECIAYHTGHLASMMER
jgi:fructosamine-3-kinase